jgi:hypothetical protein
MSIEATGKVGFCECAVLSEVPFHRIKSYINYFHYPKFTLQTTVFTGRAYTQQFRMS